MKALKSLWRKTGGMSLLLGILMAVSVSFTAWAAEVPAEYKEVWDAFKAKEKELLGRDEIYWDSDVANVVKVYEEKSKETVAYLDSLSTDDRSKVVLALDKILEDANIVRVSFSSNPEVHMEGIHKMFYVNRAAIAYDARLRSWYLYAAPLDNASGNHWDWSSHQGTLVKLCYVENGAAVQNGWREIDGRRFYFKNTEPVTGKTEIDGKYYCFNGLSYTPSMDYKTGMVTNCWVGNNYYGSDGAMLTNTVTPDRYQVDENGKKGANLDALELLSAYQEPKGGAVYVFNKINELRAQNGLEPLLWSPEMTACLHHTLDSNYGYGGRLEDFGINASGSSIYFWPDLEQGGYEAQLPEIEKWSWILSDKGGYNHIGIYEGIHNNTVTIRKGCLISPLKY